MAGCLSAYLARVTAWESVCTYLAAVEFLPVHGGGVFDHLQGVLSNTLAVEVLWQK